MSHCTTHTLSRPLQSQDAATPLLPPHFPNELCQKILSYLSKMEWPNTYCVNSFWKQRGIEQSVIQEYVPLQRCFQILFHFTLGEKKYKTLRQILSKDLPLPRAHFCSLSSVNRYVEGRKREVLAAFIEQPLEDLWELEKKYTTTLQGQERATEKITIPSYAKTLFATARLFKTHTLQSVAPEMVWPTYPALVENLIQIDATPTAVRLLYRCSTGFIQRQPFLQQQLEKVSDRIADEGSASKVLELSRLIDDPKHRGHFLSTICKKSCEKYLFDLVEDLLPHVADLPLTSVDRDWDPLHYSRCRDLRIPTTRIKEGEFLQTSQTKGKMYLFKAYLDRGLEDKALKIADTMPHHWRDLTIGSLILHLIKKQKFEPLHPLLAKLSPATKHEILTCLCLALIYMNKIREATAITQMMDPLEIEAKKEIPLEFLRQGKGEEAKSLLPFFPADTFQKDVRLRMTNPFPRDCRMGDSFL